MIFLLKQNALKEIEIVKGEIDFSQGVYKRLYEVWREYHLTKENITKKEVRAKREQALRIRMAKLHIKEIELIYWFATHKQMTRL